MPVPTKENVSRPLAAGYDVLIEYGDTDADSLYLRAAVGPGRQLTFQTVGPEERGPSLVENPEDMRPVSGQTFSRSDFSGGEGLRFAHRRDGTDFDWSRFYDSAGVSVASGRSGEPQPIRLARETESAGVTTETIGGGRHALTVHAGSHRVFYVHIGFGGTLVQSANPFGLSPTWSSDAADAGDGTEFVEGVAVLDGYLYAQTEDGIHRRDVAGFTWEHWSDLTGFGMWAAKRRLLVYSTADRVLYEARPGAGSVPLLSLGPQETVTDVIDAGGVILAAATNGIIYHFAEEDGELVLVGESVFSDSEHPTTLAASSGVVLIGTRIPGSSSNSGSGRLWRGAVVGQRIASLQLLREFGQPGTIFDLYPNASLAVGDSIYVAVREDEDTIGVWRYVLSTGGLYRHMTYPTASGSGGRRPEAIAAIGNRLLFATREQGLRREAETYESAGYLITPLADFYNDDTKAWREVRLRLGNMPEGTAVSVAYSLDPAALDDPNHASWTTAIAEATTSGEHRVNLVDVEGRWLALKVMLETDDPSETPEVLSVAARALMKPTEQDWQIPINVSDRLELPHRKPLLVPGLGEQVRDAMQALVGKVVTVTLLRPDEKVVGQIVGVSEPIQEIPERGSPSVYALLTVRGERQAS